MDAVGLTVGVVGLASLFSSCLEAVDKVQTYRSFGSDSHVLDTKFKATKVRLEEWGRRVGFEGTTRSEDHHPALDNCDIYATVRDILQIINTLCDASDGSAYHTDRAMTPSDDVSLGSLRPRPHGMRRRKLIWTLWGKTERTDQVELFEELVQQLHNLVSVDAMHRTLPVHELDTRRADNLASGLGTSSGSTWPAELQQILARIEEANRAETRRAIHSWLGRGSPNERYYDSIQQRIVGTCDWIFHRPAFQNWLDQDFPTGAKLLWINGPAGFGKTILCAHVVERLSSTLKTPVTHFFFSSDLESREDPFVAVRSWVSQVVSQHGGAFEHVRQNWEADSDPVATRANTILLFAQLLRVIPGCTFLVDGLDECAHLDNNSTSVTKFLHAVIDAVIGTNTRVLVVSRAEPEIRTALTENISESFTEYQITSDDVRSDTAAYSRYIIDRKLPNKSDDIRSTLSKAMTDQCKGQFVWLTMQEESLWPWMNEKQLQHAIEDTPTELDRVYKKNWTRITQYGERKRLRAFALLRWAAFALRPLTVCEIAEAVLIDECEDLPLEDLPDAADDDYINSEIVRLCGPLLEVRSQHSHTSAGLRTVRLTHFSVKQYLLCNLPTPGWMGDQRLRDRYQNTLLARACLHYINFQRVWREAPDHPPCLGVTFRDYAATSWHHHIKSGLRTDEEMSTLAIRFLDRSNHAWNGWRAWYDEQNVGLQKLGAESTSPGPLYYAVELELIGAATVLVKEQSCDMNERNDLGRSALHVASAKGCKEVVKILLDANADITTTDKNGWTPLHSASLNGYIEVVKLLIEKGTSIAVAANAGATPLHLASLNGHIEVVRLLIEKGASTTTTDEDGWTPLHWASQNGHIEVVKLLIEKGADVAVASKNGWITLHLATQNGHTEVVKLLIKKGAGMTITDEDGWTHWI